MYCHQVMVFLLQILFYSLNHESSVALTFACDPLDVLWIYDDSFVLHWYSSIHHLCFIHAAFSAIVNYSYQYRKPLFA